MTRAYMLTVVLWVGLWAILAGRGSGSQALLAAKADIGMRRSGETTVEEVASPDWTFYHRTDDILRELQETAADCEHIRFDKVKISEGDPAEVVEVVLGNGIKSKIREMVTNAFHRRIHVVAVCGEHGRELISSEIALQTVRLVCRGRGEAAEEARNELKRSEIHLIPVLGTWGRKKVEEGDQCERLNSGGVDLNRNWGYQWGRSDTTTEQSEEKPGHGPFSEFETRAMKRIVERVRPAAYISIHSGDQAILMPWDHSTEDPAPEDYTRLSKVAGKLADMHCQDCKMGNVYRLFGYNAFGTAVDWVFGVAKVPFVYTWEVYGNSESSVDDCFRMFNPTDRQAYDRIVDNWSRALFSLAGIVHLATDGLEQMPMPQVALNPTKISTPHRRSGFASEWRRRGQGGSELVEPKSNVAVVLELMVAVIGMAVFIGAAHYVRTKITRESLRQQESFKIA